MIPLTAAERVHSKINRLPYISDSAHYHRADYWTQIDAKGGDCEDYALAKRAALLDEGAAPDDLRIALCWTETSDYHAVLIVTTDAGEFVADNRFEQLMRRDELERIGYRWDAIQSVHSPTGWAELV